MSEYCEYCSNAVHDPTLHRWGAALAERERLMADWCERLAAVAKRRWIELLADRPADLGRGPLVSHS
jgi:hypothetical protein